MRETHSGKLRGAAQRSSRAWSITSCLISSRNCALTVSGMYVTRTVSSASAPTSATATGVSDVPFSSVAGRRRRTAGGLRDCVRLSASFHRVFFGLLDQLRGVFLGKHATLNQPIDQIDGDVR